MYRNTVVFGVTWRAACSLHLPTNECEITGCSWSTFSSDLFEHLCIFFFLSSSSTNCDLHPRTNTNTNTHHRYFTEWLCCVWGRTGQDKPSNTHTHTHKLLLVFSRQWWPWVQSLLLACEQNAKLTPVTHSCVCVFQSFQKFRLTSTDESFCILQTRLSKSFHTFKGSCHIKSMIRACGLCEYWINFSPRLSFT